MIENQTMRRYNSALLKYKCEGKFKKLSTKPFDKGENRTTTFHLVMTLASQNPFLFVCIQLVVFVHLK